MPRGMPPGSPSQPRCSTVTRVARSTLSKRTSTSVVSPGRKFRPRISKTTLAGGYKAAGIRLKALIDRGVERFLYVYDFADDWRHDIFIESVGDGEAGVDYVVQGQQHRGERHIDPAP